MSKQKHSCKNNFFTPIFLETIKKKEKMSVLEEYNVTMREGDILTYNVSVNFSTGSTFVEVKVPSCLQSMKGGVESPRSDLVGAPASATFNYRAVKVTGEKDTCSLVFRGGRSWDKTTWYFIKANIKVLPKRNRAPKTLSLNNGSTERFGLQKMFQ